MKLKVPSLPSPVNDEFGFRAWRGEPSVMPVAHMHTDLEINFVVSGGMDYFICGRFVRLLPGQLMVFWAGTPHQMVGQRKQTETYWVTIPLPWFMQWPLPDKFREQLLSGEVLLEPKPDPSRHALFAQWAEDFKSTPERRKITALEVEALLRRLALAQPKPGGELPKGHSSDLVTRIARYAGENYRELTGLAQIADTFKLNPNYLTQAFAKATGMSLWDYVIRLRIAHSQRLLLMSDLSVLEVALDSGFASVSRFHASFQKYCLTTPRQFRRAM
ncbi:MAG: helix-turn-helix domain-containing protein [Verrucomicrobiota bacterium]